MRERLAVFAVLLVALVAGCSSSPPPTVPVEQSTQAPAPAPAGQGYSLSIDTLDVRDTPLALVGLNPDRTLATPPVERPEQAAVYERGPMPGEAGPAIVLGHVNGAGRAGVFARLAELGEGDRIVARGPDGEHVFVVYRSVTVDKADFPTADVYSDTEGPELRLITCGGDLDRSAHSYLGQVIVFARQA